MIYTWKTIWGIAFATQQFLTRMFPYTSFWVNSDFPLILIKGNSVVFLRHKPYKSSCKNATVTSLTLLWHVHKESYSWHYLQNYPPSDHRNAITTRLYQVCARSPQQSNYGTSTLRWFCWQSAQEASGLTQPHSEKTNSTPWIQRRKTSCGISSTGITSV